MAHMEAEVQKSLREKLEPSRVFVRLNNDQREVTLDDPDCDPVAACIDKTNAILKALTRPRIPRGQEPSPDHLRVSNNERFMKMTASVIERIAKDIVGDDLPHPDVRVRAGKPSPTCPYCKDDLPGTGFGVTCFNCRATVHEPCAIELGRCPSCNAVPEKTISADTSAGPRDGLTVKQEREIARLRLEREIGDSSIIRDQSEKEKGDKTRQNHRRLTSRSEYCERCVPVSDGGMVTLHPSECCGLDFSTSWDENDEFAFFGRGLVIVVVALIIALFLGF